MAKKIVGLAPELNRRVWFRLLEAGEKALAEHNARAKAINARNKRRARRFTENKQASPAYKGGGDYFGVWLPAAVEEFPGARCTGTTRDARGKLNGRYWEPARNKNSGKLFAEEVAKWEKLPVDRDFVKALAPQLRVDDFSEDGNYFVRATVGTLAGVVVVGVPNCAHNRKAEPHPALQPMKPSEVLALYEKQEELEEAEMAGK